MQTVNTLLPGQPVMRRTPQRALAKPEICVVLAAERSSGLGQRPGDCRIARLNALTLSARRVSMVDALLHQLLEQLLRVLAVDLAGNQRPKDHSADRER